MIVGNELNPVAGPVNVAGGWFDAGDFIKFAHTTAYADTLLLLTQRRSGAATPPSLKEEIRFGLRWLHKAWAPQHNVVYIQVGIGSGNQSGSFNGDHDVWRLPQRDDKLTGRANRYLRDRPVFATDARPGKPHRTWPAGWRQRSLSRHRWMPGPTPPGRLGSCGRQRRSSAGPRHTTCDPKTS